MLHDFEERGLKIKHLLCLLQIRSKIIGVDLNVQEVLIPSRPLMKLLMIEEMTTKG